MFNLSYDTPCEIQGIIEVDKPIYMLGPVTDIHKKQWDIRGVYSKDGKAVVQACPMSSMHPYYTSTCNQNFGMVHQRWLPYKVKVVSSK